MSAKDEVFQMVLDALNRVIETEIGNYMDDTLPPSIEEAIELVRKIEVGEI